MLRKLFGLGNKQGNEVDRELELSEEIIIDIDPESEEYTELDPISEEQQQEIDINIIRTNWNNGETAQEIETITMLKNMGISPQYKLQLISSLCYNCYSKSQYNSMVKYLPYIYRYIQNIGTTISNMSKKDVFEGLFRKRNEDFQKENIRIFAEEMNRWLNEEYDANSIVYWVKDIMEIDRPIVRKGISDYLWSWIDTDVLPHTTIRERFIWQFHACQIILDYCKQDYIDGIATFLLDIGRNEDYSTYIRGDAMDIVLRNRFPEQYTDQITETMHVLGQAREIERHNMVLAQRELGAYDILHGTAFGATIAKTTYNSSQTVHDTSINDALKENLLVLVKDSEKRGNTIDKVCERIELEFEKMSDFVSHNYRYNQAIRSLNRFKTDPSKFTEKRITLGNILVLVWNRIERSEHKADLIVRLSNELSEAYNTCASGHASRCVATLIGYFDDLKQGTSFESQLKDNIVARINKSIKDSPTDIRDDLYIGLAFDDSEEYITLIKYLAEQRDPIFDELFAEFVPDFLTQESFERVFEQTWFK